MTEEEKAKFAAATAAAKAKAKEIVSKENIGKVKDGVKNGVESLKTAEGRQRLKKSVIVGATTAKNKVVETWKSGPKGKAICIGTAAVLLLILNGMFGDDSMTFTEASDSPFALLFRSNITSSDGEAFEHTKNHLVKVLSVVDDGVIVHFDQTGFGAELVGGLYSGLTGESDKIIHVETERGGYVDGGQLESGIFVRHGSFTYETAIGGTSTVESYSEITDSGEIERFHKVIDDRKKARKNREEAEKADEARKQEEAKKKAQEEAKAVAKRRRAKFEELFTAKEVDNVAKTVTGNFIIQKSLRQKFDKIEIPLLARLSALASEKKWPDVVKLLKAQIKPFARLSGVEAFEVGEMLEADEAMKAVRSGCEIVRASGISGYHRGYTISFNVKDNLVCCSADTIYAEDFSGRHSDDDSVFFFLMQRNENHLILHSCGDENSTQVFLDIPVKTYAAQIGSIKDFFKQNSNAVSRWPIDKVEEELGKFLAAQ